MKSRRHNMVTAKMQGLRRGSARCLSVLAAAGMLLASCASTPSNGENGASDAEEIGISVIIKTATNPFYVQVQNGAEEEAEKYDNVRLTTSAGKDDFDTQTQINAIEDAITRGDKGILIIHTGEGVFDAIERARDAGIYVIALDNAP